MSKVIHLADKLRAVAPHIRTEDEAIEAAKALADEIRAGSNLRDRQCRLPHQEMERTAQSGLLGITVPSDYGGTDITNPFLAEVVAILAEADSSIGQILQNHFYILDVLRLAGSEAQKRYFLSRALAGDHFANAFAEQNSLASGVITTTLVEDGPGYRISGEKYYSTGALFADWIAVFARTPQDRIAMAIMPREAEGLTIADDWTGFGQRTTASGTVVIDDIYVTADCVIDHDLALEQPSPLGALGELLHAAVDLGIARAAFADMIGIGAVGNDPLAVAKTGSIAVTIEAAAALIERAGRKVDMAQVSPSAEAAAEASLAVASARILTTEAALEATSTLIELAGTVATEEGLNLDRRWRNAQPRTVPDPVRWKHHAIGDYHLNGRLPQPSSQF